MSCNGPRNGCYIHWLPNDNGCYGIRKGAFVDGIEVGGAVTFLEFAKDADVTLTFKRVYYFFN